MCEHDYLVLRQKEKIREAPPSDERPRATPVLVAIMVCRHCLDRQEVEL